MRVMNEAGQVRKLPIDDVLPNRFQPRIKFSESEVLALADSIKNHGVIQPILVRPIGDKFEIIAGERRYKASVMAGLKEIPAIVRQLDDKQSAELALIENVQRKDLTPIEEALSYKKILDMGYLTQEQLALKLGKKQSTIANKLRLLNLDEDVQNALLYENGSTPFVWRECFKREFLLENKLIFDEGLWLSEDLVFLFKAFPNANRIIYIPDKLYHYRWERNNSAMNKASCNLFRKYQSHIDAVEKIAQYWEENKFMLSRGGDFFAWSVAFLGADLTHYSGSGKNILIKRIWDVWETFNLNKYYDMLSSEHKFYYKQFSSIINKMDNIAN